jgi:hypothetical protein
LGPANGELSGKSAGQKGKSTSASSGLCSRYVMLLLYPIVSIGHYTPLSATICRFVDLLFPCFKRSGSDWPPFSIVCKYADWPLSRSVMTTWTVRAIHRRHHHLLLLHQRPRPKTRIVVSDADRAILVGVRGSLPRPPQPAAGRWMTTTWPSGTASALALLAPCASHHAILPFALGADS